MNVTKSELYQAMRNCVVPLEVLCIEAEESGLDNPILADMTEHIWKELEKDFAEQELRARSR